MVYLIASDAVFWRVLPPQIVRAQTKQMDQLSRKSYTTNESLKAKQTTKKKKKKLKKIPIYFEFLMMWYIKFTYQPTGWKGIFVFVCHLFELYHVSAIFSFFLQF